MKLHTLVGGSGKFYPFSRRNWTTSGCPFLAAYIKAVQPFSDVSLRTDGEWLQITVNLATSPSAAEEWNCEIISCFELFIEDIFPLKK